MTLSWESNIQERTGCTCLPHSWRLQVSTLKPDFSWNLMNANNQMKNETKSVLWKAWLEHRA